MSAELMEQATAERPLQFIFGANMMLDAFERELKGLGEGDTFSFSLTPEEAYGEYEEERVIELPKKIFEVDGKIDKKVLFEGNTLPMMDSAGNRLMGSVVAIKDDTVTMDFNHPARWGDHAFRREGVVRSGSHGSRDGHDLIGRL